MKKYLIINFLSILLFAVLNSGCLEDSVQPDLNVDLDNTARLLVYLESEGDYFNSEKMPSLVDPFEVHGNINNYLILDVRPKDDFLSGHIEHAISIKPSKLVEYFDSVNSYQYQKIVLISKDGQAASYYTCLLRLLGYENVYALKFGMAAWHSDFSQIWFNSLGNRKGIWNFDNIQYAKPKLENLPPISFNEQGLSISENLKSRISAIMDLGFNEQTAFNSIEKISKVQAGNKLFEFDSDPTVEFKTLYTYYNPLNNNFDDHFIICFGSTELYHPWGRGGSDLELPAHPPSSVLYLNKIFPDLRSSTNLQSLPANAEIDVYSAAGQLGAFAAAYLRVLGYNAKSILFGANNFEYDSIISSQFTDTLAFTSQEVKDLPYQTGE